MTTGEVLRAAVIEDPYDQLPKDALSDWMEEQGEDMEMVQAMRQGKDGDPGRVPVNDFDRGAIRELAQCRCRSHGSYDGRFARDIFQLVIQLNRRWLTAKQYMWVWVLLRRYRKQVKSSQHRAEAECRYQKYCRLLDLAWKPESFRHRTKKTTDQPTMFDGLNVD